MKKLSLCVVTSAIFAFLLIAPVAAQVQFGAKAGLAFADQDFDYYVSGLELTTDWRTGIAGGIFAETAPLPYLALRLEALYIQKGHQQDITVIDEGLESHIETFHYRLDVLSLNLLARGFLRTGTYAMAGPRLDIKLGTSDDFPPDEALESLEDVFSSTVAGITFGLGQEFQVPGLGAAFIEGQYYLDMGKLYDHGTLGEDEIATLKSIKNRSFALYAGIRF